MNIARARPRRRGTAVTAREAGARLGGALVLASAAGAFAAAPAIMSASLGLGLVMFVVAAILAGFAAYDAGRAIEAIVAAIREPVRMSVEPMAGDLSPRGEALRRATEDDSLTTTRGRRP